MRVFFSAGEASGDAYAAALARELGSENVTIEGVGGRQLAALAGGQMLDSSSWGAISISQVLVMAPRFIAGYFKATRRLARGTPGLMVPIDFGYFNVRLAKFAKRRGWNVLYFVPPASWRRDRQGKDLPAITDAIVTPFPWSEEMLTKMGANTFFFGHPLKQLIEASPPADGSRTTLAILPGSRAKEIARNLPLIADCLLPVLDALPAPPALEFGVAWTANAAEMEAEWKRLAPGRPATFNPGDTPGVLRRARAAVVCSGTATLEAALLRTPMAVVYRVTKAMAREYKLVGFKLPEYIALPNILLERRLVPEFLVGETYDKGQISEAIRAVIEDETVRADQIAGFGKIDELLGPADAITRTAQLARTMLQ